MSLLSLNAKSWNVLSQSPLVIESTIPTQSFRVRLFENRELEILIGNDVFTAVDADLDLDNVTISTSEDEQYFYFACAKSGVTAAVKRESEGVVIDVFGPTDDSDVDTCCAFYAELQDDDTDEDE